MKLSEFDYTLPKDLIAQYPLAERDRCRLMVLDRARRSITGENFHDIVKYLKKGDCLVLNNTKVIAARLFARRKTGGRVEVFLLGTSTTDPVAAERHNRVGCGGQTTCEALIRPSLRVKEGERIILESGIEAEVLGRGHIGRFIRFKDPLDEILNDIGHVPLPPYIERLDTDSDAADYQTVFGVKEGATASPTAGLHFTRELLDRVAGNGVRVTYVTLHTNYGTFAPIKTDIVENHKMHSEFFELSQGTIDDVLEMKRNGGRVVAVGTTTTRVLEHWGQVSTIDKYPFVNCGDLAPIAGCTDMFIYPGYKFKIVDCLITNFHQPRSTLLLLVSAFAGKDFILEAYRKAIEARYRFYSYGDAMIIL